MIILSNCLTNTADEGCRTVAANLIRRLKQLAPETVVAADVPGVKDADLYLPMNKLMLNPRVFRLTASRKESVLHVPSPTRSLPAAVRMFLMSLYVRRDLYVLITMHYPISKLAGLLMKLSHAKVITISQQAYQSYRNVIGKRALYVKMGVDTERFHPVSGQEKAELRQKHGIPQDKTIVLHVGHLNAGRNVGQMLKLDDRFHGILIVSTQTASRQDQELRQKLQSKPNLTLIDTFVPNIEEYYQLSDVYLFPVEKGGYCIDVPISALEAASSGLPVAGTPYGELAQLLGTEGFEQISSFETAKLNEQLSQLAAQGAQRGVKEYDWSKAAQIVIQLVQNGSVGEAEGTAQKAKKM